MFIFIMDLWLWCTILAFLDASEGWVALTYLDVLEELGYLCLCVCLAVTLEHTYLPPCVSEQDFCQCITPLTRLNIRDLWHHMNCKRKRMRQEKYNTRYDHERSNHEAVFISVSSSFFARPSDLRSASISAAL